ncbi:hypothetical protein F5141DRAFT_1130798 [Pisolithus sp. B1]|nr:hypothetical protein F5141DRAFT_1130798 [Pisolithus sp. B1]
MTNFLLLARYNLFGLFVICNAVWNHSLALSSQTLQIDIYLAFLGAFGLLFAVIITFVEVLFNNPFTARIWFESGWVAVFWLMELAGATVVSVISGICGSQSTVASTSSCISERLLLAFTWTCTGVLLVYFVLVVITTVTYQRDNPDVWHSTVRRLHSSTGHQSLSSPLNSPSTARFKNGSQSLPAPAPVVTYAPRPVRPAVWPGYFNRDRAGLGSEYEIEGYKSPPPERMTFAEQMDVEYRNSLREAVPIPPLGPTHVSTVRPLPSIAPLSIPVTITARSHEDTRRPIDDSSTGRRELPSTVAYSNGHSSSRIERRELPAQPSLLGDWPRPDIMKQPITRKRRNQDSLSFPEAAGNQRGQVTQPSTEVGAVSVGAGHHVHAGSAPSHQPGARRPSGPRLRLPSNDLTVISQRQVPP